MKGLSALLVAAVILAAGLLAFAERVERSTPAPQPPRADGSFEVIPPTAASIAAIAAIAKIGPIIGISACDAAAPVAAVVALAMIFGVAAPIVMPTDFAAPAVSMPCLVVSIV